MSDPTSIQPRTKGTPTMSMFTEYADRLKAANVPLLGLLVWYSVSDLTLRWEDLGRALAECDLGAYIPPPPQDANVFKRVCSDAQRRRQKTADSAVYENYLIRDCGADSSTITRRIVQEVVNTAARDLTYEQEMGEIHFRRSDGSVSVTCTGSNVIVQDIARQILDNYDAERGTVGPYTIREDILRRSLVSAGCTNTRGRGGGIYFCPQTKVDIVVRLEQLADKIPGEAVMVHSLPLIDDTKQRDMLRRAFESESVDEIDKILDELADLLDGTSNRKPSENLLADLLDRYHHLAGKAKEYSELLELGLATTDGRLKIFKRQLVKLSGMVGDDDA